MDKTTYFYPNSTLRMGDTLLDLSTPRIMGILNTTPDSFFDGSRHATIELALEQAEKMISEGADILDIGGMSTRPGAGVIAPETEAERVIPVIQAIRKQFPLIPLSVDTVHSLVAVAAIEAGAQMVNDVSAGTIDPQLWPETARLKVPYVLMHMQGLPLTMQQQPEYTDVVREVTEFFLAKIKSLKQLGIQEIVIDPGFGFGKNLSHNYQLAARLDDLQVIGAPIMAGISRKSMICQLLKRNPDQALNGTTAIHMALLLKGIHILRVHDVKEAKEVVKIAEALRVPLTI